MNRPQTGPRGSPKHGAPINPMYYYTQYIICFTKMYYITTLYYSKQGAPINPMRLLGKPCSSPRPVARGSGARRQRRGRQTSVPQLLLRHLRAWTLGLVLHEREKERKRERERERECGRASESEQKVRIYGLFFWISLSLSLSFSLSLSLSLSLTHSLSSQLSTRQVAVDVRRRKYPQSNLSQTLLRASSGVRGFSERYSS